MNETETERVSSPLPWDQGGYRCPEHKTDEHWRNDADCAAVEARVQACHHAPAADEPDQWPEGYRCPICEPPSGRASSPFLTVGELRKELEGLPDDAQITITSSLNHTYDQGITQTLHEPLIEWDHDCTDAPDEHNPGVDCPVRVGLELWLNSYEEAVRDA